MINFGRFKKLKCSSCNKQVTVPALKIVLFSIYSQFTGLAGLITLLTIFSGPYSITTMLIVGPLGYVLGLIPAIYFYLRTTEFITKTSN